MVLLQLCRWKFSHKETLQQTLFDWTLILFTKTTNSVFEPPYGAVRGNVRTSSIARWDVHGQLPICDNWWFFASSYGLDFMSRYWSKSAFFKGGWVTLRANFRWTRTSPTILCWYQKTRVITLLCGIKISAVCSFISSQSTRVTDGQNYDPQDRACRAASHGKNSIIPHCWSQSDFIWHRNVRWTRWVSVNLIWKFQPIFEKSAKALGATFWLAWYVKYINLASLSRCIRFIVLWNTENNKKVVYSCVGKVGTNLDLRELFDNARFRAAAAQLVYVTFSLHASKMCQWVTALWKHR